MSPVRPRIIAYSSGRWPCGIADYHRRLTPHLAADVETVTFPTERVLRDRPLALLAQRRAYRRLARRSDGFDAAIIECASGWNANRPGEFLLPVFVNRLRRPLLLVLHEWPDPVASGAQGGGAVPRRLRVLAERIVRTRDFRGLSPDQWIRTRFFERADHIVVHAEHLRRDLLSMGVAEDRVTYSVLPAYPLASAAAPASDMAAPGARIVLLFGFPHPRKNYELAVQALPHLPDDVVMIVLGSTSGSFREAYANELRRLAESLRVSNRLIFTGEVDEARVAALFGQSTVALSPSSYITGSASLAYLIAAGVPIVASDLSQVRTLHAEGAGIELFATGDVASCVAQLRAVLDNESLRHALKAKHAAFAQSHTFAGLGRLVTSQLQTIVAKDETNTRRRI